MAKARKIIAVYRIKNVVSGSFYIGSSGNLYERWRVHKNKLRRRSHPNPKLQAAWDKYGEDAFKFELLEEFSSTTAMEALEQALLHEHLGNAACYNLAEWVAAPMRGRTGSLHPRFGKVMPETARASLSESTKRQWATSDPRTGKFHTAETKAKISAKTQAALAEGRGGRFIPSEETRKKMSEALKKNRCAKGHIRSEEHRRKLSEVNKGNQNWLGKKHSEESRQKMSKPVLEVSTNVEFPSLTIVLQYYGMTMPTLRRALLAGTPITKGKFAGLSFRYVDQLPPI
jgi:group I intron endonuclease